MPIPVLPAPAPELDFEADLGDINKESPNCTTPPDTFVIWTGPIIAGIISLLSCKFFLDYFEKTINNKSVIIYHLRADGYASL
jgi:hypothetical protein